MTAHLYRRMIEASLPMMQLEVADRQGRRHRGDLVPARALLMATIGASRREQEEAVMSVLRDGYLQLTPRTRLVVHGW